MFSGLVEAQAQVLKVEEAQGLIRMWVEKPRTFDDVQIGHSIACDGVCLTVEEVAASTLRFAMAAETLRVTGWSASHLTGHRFNLERALRLGDRLHGHLVLGHVDAMGKVSERTIAGESLVMAVAVPLALRPYFWEKGSCTVNGVSLTINSIRDGVACFCLIPETLEKTNLSGLAVGDAVTLEVDLLARGIMRLAQQQMAAKEGNP